MVSFGGERRRECGRRGGERGRLKPSGMVTESELPQGDGLPEALGERSRVQSATMVLSCHSRQGCARLTDNIWPLDATALRLPATSHRASRRRQMSPDLPMSAYLLLARCHEPRAALGLLLRSLGASMMNVLACD